jgi:hypothetical protein
LFEVHLPRLAGTAHWDWISDDSVPVTLLAAHPPDEPADRCRLRFRAEGPGEAVLRFRADPDRRTSALPVRIVPEMIAS